MAITVDELISSLCTNNIRFTYVEPKYKDEIPSNFVEEKSKVVCPKCKTHCNETKCIHPDQKMDKKC